MKMGLGITAGGIGAFVGTPAEVALIREQISYMPSHYKYLCSISVSKGKLKLNGHSVQYRSMNYWMQYYDQMPKIR
jgi:hypothetical protein